MSKLGECLPAVNAMVVVREVVQAHLDGKLPVDVADLYEHVRWVRVRYERNSHKPQQSEWAQAWAGLVVELEHFTLICSHLVRGSLGIMRALSMDLRERVLAAYEQGGSTRQQVAERFRVSLGMVKKLLAQQRHARPPDSCAPRRGRPPKVRLVHQRRLRSLVRRQPDLTLEQLRAASGLACSLVAIHRALVKLGLTYKKRRCAPASRIGLT